MPPAAHAGVPARPETSTVAQNGPARLPLGMAESVRLTLEGSDLVAVEAAAAWLKARFGTRFSVTGRRMRPDRQALRISASLLADGDTAMQVEGSRRGALPEGSGMIAGGAGCGDDAG